MTKKKTVAENSTRSVEDVLAAFNKLNKTELIVMDDQFIKREIPATSFGSPRIDMASGVGGAPHGRMIEVFGENSAGKTTSIIMLCAQVQKAGNMVAFLDFENALSPSYCANLGFDLSKALFLQPDSGEQGLDAAEDLAKVFSPGDLIVVDSVAAITPQAEINGEMGDSHMGLQARLISQACRKIMPIVSKNGVIFVWINQVRQKLGVTWGDPLETPGGKSIKFYSSQRLKVSRTKTVKDKEGVPVLNHIKVKFVKNKVSSPFKEAETIIRFGEGIPYTYELVDLAIEADLISRGGAGWLTYGEVKLQGTDKMEEYLKENPEVLEKLEQEVKDYYKI